MLERLFDYICLVIMNATSSFLSKIVAFRKKRFYGTSTSVGNEEYVREDGQVPVRDIKHLEDNIAEYKSHAFDLIEEYIGPLTKTNESFPMSIHNVLTFGTLGWLFKDDINEFFRSCGYVFNTIYLMGHSEGRSEAMVESMMDDVAGNDKTKNKKQDK